MAQGSPSSGVTKNAQVQQDSLVLTVDNDFAGLTMRPAVGKLLGKHADTRVFFAVRRAYCEVLDIHTVSSLYFYSVAP